ncbi:MAG: hypothetical protein K6A38_05335 [Lachnospiraceae bacterium]|nr:hypothetical protein [Lachnospiraceae bacterium]
MVIDAINKHDEYVIYGAQVVAYGAKTAIEYLTGKKPLCFAVGKFEGNPKEIEGIPVILIDEIPTDTFVVVGITELVQKEVIPALSVKGFKNIYPLTSHEEHLLMSEYYRKVGLFPLAKEG